jgi:hypothetical protein
MNSKACEKRNCCCYHCPSEPAYRWTLCPMPGIYLVDLVHYKEKGQRAENRIVKLLLIYPHDYGFLEQRFYMLSVILSS